MVGAAATRDPCRLPAPTSRVLVPALVLLVAAACGPDDAWRSAPLPDRGPVSPEAAPLPDDAPEVLLRTSLGDIRIGLYAERAPRSVENFLRYVDEGFYDGTVVHRVLDRPEMAVVQAGGHDRDMSLKPTRPGIPNEAANGLRNLRGTVAMARIGGVIDSATSQFYVNVIDNPHLDHRGPEAGEFGYAVFGKVLDGMEVIDRIAMVPTRGDQPLATILIEEAERIGGSPTEEGA